MEYYLVKNKEKKIVIEWGYVTEKNKRVDNLFNGINKRYKKSIDFKENFL